MRISEPQIVAALPGLGVELRPGARRVEMTSLGIGGTTDLLLIRDYRYLPELIGMLGDAGIRHRFLGGGTNVLIANGELPWVVLQLASQQPDVRIDGNFAQVAASADLGRTVTMCAKANLGGMEGL